MSLLRIVALILVASRSVASISQAVMTASIDLIDAGHALHFLEVVDAYGHVSVRNPDDPSQFLMSTAIAPALVASKDLVTYKIDNATAVQLTFNSSVTGASVPTGFVERYIHSEIYKAFPTVLSVVHSHTIEVLAFGNAGVGLKAQKTTGGSIGTSGTPIFDAGKLSSSILPNDALHDLLIRNEPLGDALAKSFSKDSDLVLMKGHGMAIRAPSVRDAVFRAFYAKQDAIVQFQATLLGGGRQPSGLNMREAADAANTTEGVSLLGRAWNLWVKQLDTSGFYINDLRNGSAPSSPGA